MIRSEKAGHQAYGAAVSIESSEVIEVLEPTVDPGKHRLYARIVPYGSVQAEYPGMTSVVRDVSPAGAFVEDERPLPVGRLFQLRLRSDRLRKEIELGAVVRRSEPHVGMAVEFVALSRDAKLVLQDLVKEGRPWQGAQAAFPSGAWEPADASEAKINFDDAIKFLRQRAAKVVGQLEVVGCHYRVGDKSFSIHLRDPVSRAELLLPISERWLLDGQATGDYSRVDRVLGAATRILDLAPPAPADD